MTTKEQFAALWAQLGTVEGACCRVMMGEYVLYYEGRVIGGIYDGRVLVKDLPAARRLAKKYKVEMPIVENVGAILDGTLAARDALAALMGRNLKAE